MLDTPVAFIIFNRPDLTQLVFEAIAKAKPRKLLVIADGPRFPEEAEKCRQAREVIQNVDWECEVLTNFSDINLGCKMRPATGLDWVFSLVEEAIILEDDCLPHIDFFVYCAELLEKYRDDERIMTISGNNFQSEKQWNTHSYYFSNYTLTWGWASWRRAWQHYDVAMEHWPEIRDSSLLPFNDENEKGYWVKILNSVYEGKIDAWDYQWSFACWSQNSLTVIPSKNLVSNIGFREDATHTQGNSVLASIPTATLGKLQHPQYIAKHNEADKSIFYSFFDDRQNERGRVRAIKKRLRPLKQRIVNIWKKKLSSFNRA